MRPPPLPRGRRRLPPTAAASSLLLLPLLLLPSSSAPPRSALALTTAYLDDPVDAVAMEYEITDGALRATVSFDGAEGWVAVGFPGGGGDDGMVGADAVVGFPGTGEVVKYDLTSRSDQSRMSDDRQTLRDASVERRDDGRTVMTFTKVLEEGGGENPIASAGSQSVIWARGSSDAFAHHSAKGKARIEMAGGAAAAPPPPPDGGSSPPDLAVGDEVCVEGYVMDQYCIGLGVLLDMQLIVTLERPDLHTVHCLVDVPRCINSGYEILIDPIVEGRTTYCRGYLLDGAGNWRVLEVARSVGVCDECTGEGTLERGFRASVRGTVTDVGDDSTPAAIAVTDLVHAGAGGNSSDACGEGTTRVPPSGWACVDPGATSAPTSSPAPTFGARTVFLDPPSNRVAMRYEVVNAGGRGALRATVAYGGLGWLGVGFPREGEDGMVGADAVVGLPNTNEVVKYDLHSYQEQTRMPDERQTLMDAFIWQRDGATLMTFTKFLVEDGENPIASDGSQNFIVAYGSTNSFGYHAGRGGARLDLASGGVEVMPDPHRRGRRSHGILAAAGWVFLTPIAIASSVFREMYPPRCVRGRQLWFGVHRAFNFLTWALTVTAFVIAVLAYRSSGREHFGAGHPRMGLAILVMVSLQVLGGELRPRRPSRPEGREGGSGDDDDDGTGAAAAERTPPARKFGVRTIWSVLHGSVGLAVLGCSLWQIDRGLLLYGAFYPDSGARVGVRKVFWSWMGAWGSMVVMGFIKKRILNRKRGP